MARGMQQRWLVWSVLVAGLAMGAAACTVSIPAADKFPEAQDVVAADVQKADAGPQDVDAKAADGSDVAATDAADVGAADGAGTDVADVAPDSEDVVDTADDVTGDTADADAGTDVPPDATDDVPVDAAAACTPGDCADDDPCTADTCAPGGGCAHAPASGAACADDGLACTADLCVNGTCGHGSLNGGWCLIGGACVAEGTFTPDGCASCVAALQPLAWTPQLPSVLCEDGTVCTVGDHCQGGVCLPGATTSCDDGNPCSADACDPTTGCAHPDAVNGAVCPTSGPCQLPGYCVSGACQAVSKLWEVTQDAGAGDDDRWVASAASPQGDLVVVGEQWTAGVQSAWGARLTPAGNLLAPLPPLAGAASAWVDVAVADDGTIGLVGWSDTTTILRVITPVGLQNDLVLALNNQQPTRLIAAPGGWLVLGHGAVAAVAFAVNATAPIWTTTVATPGVTWRTAAALPDGGVLLAGVVTAPDVQDMPYAARVDVQGKVLWTRAYPQAQSAEFLALMPGAESSLVARTPTGAWFAALDAQGAVVRDFAWTAPVDVAVTAATPGADGTWLVTAQTSQGAWLGSFTAAGGLAWTRNYPDLDAARATVLPDTGVLLASQTAQASGPHDGIVLRADPWGEPTCEASQLCANTVATGCPDGSPCTADLCAAGQCAHTPMADAPCDDGDPCTPVDGCLAGTCAAGAPALHELATPASAAFARVTALADGGLTVLGAADAVIRLDPAGTPLWQQTPVLGPVSVAAFPSGALTVLGQGNVLQRLTRDGALLGKPQSAGPWQGALAVAPAPDDGVYVVGTTDTGLPSQQAWWTHVGAGGQVLGQALLGSPGQSTGLAVLPAQSGAGVLVANGLSTLLTVLAADGTEVWATPLLYTTATALAAMPDGGWVTAGMSAKGVTLERRDPLGAFEFGIDWPVPNLSAVVGVATEADGSVTIAVERQQNATTMGGVLRFGPLGSFLSATWGEPGSVVTDITAVSRPGGVCVVGHTVGGAWLLRLDAHGGNNCATAGSCLTTSLLCDDANPCTQDGCAGGACTITAPADTWLCASGAICTTDHACPILQKCGDGKCGTDESSTTCPQDCTANCDVLNCDDGDPCTIDYCTAAGCQIGGVAEGTACGLGKSCTLGVCAAPPCGDGLCAAGETATSCAQDCPACGDGVCGSGENNHSCPADCWKPAVGCQNMCGWKNLAPGGGVCWCDAGCVSGPGGDCCPDKATFCP